MRVRPSRGDGGFTLIEVLAAVVALGVFMTALVALVDGVHTQAALDVERRTALSLAEESLARMSEQGAQTVIAEGPYVRTVDRVTYTVTPSIASDPPPYASPSPWSWPALLSMFRWGLGGGSGGADDRPPPPVAAQVTVTWTTSVLHRQVQGSVALTQLFPQ
ncbi:prepilin-type N-terminal cleavage/methylation domain-containing protein [Alicyclobacillus sp.]|uniref:type II secretion system protein n=1 Tax=Alicyclobacillus sp. TaxID=61169 RepID=UPI0025BB0CBA|nr:prepilin-type N-terminal cleavage/methylation domain-containing protein [Alicyclobacillus sp.]MCL6516148.1 prepilin-type N-terminal cleavage/methylation domain-containing protein [Alicyclobacillus sp.]